MIRASLIFLAFVGLVASVMDSIKGPAAFGHADKSQPTILIATADEPAASAASFDAAEAATAAIILHREMDGHFYADAEVNGATVRMLVDTGATAIALTRDDARKAGIGISIGMPNVVGQGASGDVKGEYVTVDRIRLGGTTGEGMNAVVLDGGGVSLLGQTFLSRFSSVEMHGDTMVLR